MSYNANRSEIAARAVLLWHTTPMSVAEIARELGVARPTVYGYLHSPDGLRYADRTEPQANTCGECGEACSHTASRCWHCRYPEAA